MSRCFSPCVILENIGLWRMKNGNIVNYWDRIGIATEWLSGIT